MNNNPLDVYLTAAFGLVGYVMIKLDLEPAPMLLGFVLGRLLEEKLRQAMAISQGDVWTFVEHRIAATMLTLAVIAMVVALLPAIRKSRDQAFAE